MNYTIDFESEKEHIKQLFERFHSDELPPIFPEIKMENIVRVLKNIQSNPSSYQYFVSTPNSLLNLITFNRNNHPCSPYSNSASKGFEPLHFFTFKNNNSLRELSDVNVIGYLSFVYNTLVMTMPFFENTYLSNHLLDCSLSRIFADETYYEQTIYGEWEEQLRNQFVNQFNFSNKQEKELEAERKSLYVMHLDVSNFYGSIYSHFLEREGKTETFSICEDKELYFKFLDTYSMYINSSETKGIPTGPFSSRIISELLMCNVDMELLKNIDKNIFYLRNVDDMSFFARDIESLYRAKNDVEKVLFKFKLSTSDTKTKITKCINDYTEENTKTRDLVVNILFENKEEIIDSACIANFKEEISKLIASNSKPILKSIFTKIYFLIEKDVEKVAYLQNIDFFSLLFRLILFEPFLASRSFKVIDAILKQSSEIFVNDVLAIIESFLDLIDDKFHDTIIQVWSYYLIQKYGSNEKRNSLFDKYNKLSDKNPILMLALISRDGAKNEAIYTEILSQYNSIDGTNNAVIPEKAFNSCYSMLLIKMCVEDSSFSNRINSQIPFIVKDLFDGEL